MRIVLALIALGQWRGLLAQELTTTTTQRSSRVKENVTTADKRLEFVNIIRDDLRRDNDDYALLEREHQQAQPDNLPHAVALPPYRKRMLLPEPRPQPPWPYYGDTRRGEADFNQSFQDDTAFRSYKHSENYKIVRANKLKQLLNKDKVRMREVEQHGEDETIHKLLDNKPTSSLPEPPSPPPPPPPPPPSSPATRSLPPSTPEPRPRFRPPRLGSPLPPENMERQVPVLRQRKDKRQSPSPEQLDMAAARNPELTRIRLKGRLCQRSLMNVEGPRYDKLGQQVAARYRPRHARARHFQQTRAPALVLPRCCNCCKKSVLGCQ